MGLNRAATLPEESLRTVQASIYFLTKNVRFQTEKPYAFRFPVETVQQTNMEMERRDSISITDMRGSESNFSMETNGFVVLNLESGMAYDDFHDSERVSAYFRELEALLKSHLGASHVEVFRHGVGSFTGACTPTHGTIVELIGCRSCASVTLISQSPQERGMTTTNQPPWLMSVRSASILEFGGRAAHSHPRYYTARGC